METIRQFFVNLENNMHQVIIWIFNVIHTTIDCFDAIIQQWVVIEDEDNNNRKIGFK